MKRIFAALIICSAVTTNAMADAFGTVSLDDAALQAPPKYSDEVFEVTDINL
jgi:hypothetical protein